MRREINRKLIHLASIALPLAVWLLPRRWGLALLITAAVTALAIELARTRIRGVRYQFLRRTRTMLRPGERESLTGATFMAVAYALALLIFPKPVAVLAMLYNGLGDAAAALVGRRWGRRRLTNGKSWEGAAAGFATGLLAGLLIPGVSLLGAAAGALVASALELAALPPDDNLWVVLGGGAAVWAVLAVTA